MKKALALLLFSAYLISTTEIGQLLKLPLLIEHFFKHKEQSESHSIYDFFSMHYGEHAGSDKEHEKLPFKSHDGCINSILLVSVSNTFSAPSISSFSFEIKTFNFYDDLFLTSSFQANIWQPPKFS
ncbi:MAG: hypothetical protein EYC69_12495 [Bacteroidetes bacterium]|nr:MAG: hypothetical protein EYC69_12495 [Bacteroidota bacterium]